MIGYLLNQTHVNKMRPRQDGKYFADDIFIFLKQKVLYLSLKFVPNGPIDITSAFVQIMVPNRWQAINWNNSLLTHICVTRPEWVKVVLDNKDFLTWLLIGCQPIRSRVWNFSGRDKVITSHSKLWDVVTYPCQVRYLPLAPKYDVLHHVWLLP